VNSITGLTTQSAQVSFLLLEDGSRAKLSLFYRPQQLGWFYDITWPGNERLPVPFASLGNRLVASPNLLRQFRKLIPFGLMLYTIDNLEPMGRTCFVDGTADLILLNAADVLELEDRGFPGL
jgi:hypothetical protein